MSKKRQPWRKFYSKDWRGDAPLRMCSFAARGLWVDLLSLMHESKHCGFLFVDEVVPTPRQLAGLLGGSEKEIKGLLAELADNGVFSVTGQDMPDDVKALVPTGMPDGVMLSRRMVRDEAKAEKERGNGTYGALGGNPEIPRGTVPKDQRARAFRRADNPAKTRRVFDKRDGHCHWCGEPILFESFHVDHRLAICDGGTHDEANLFPSCADCNHRRARMTADERARQEPSSPKPRPSTPSVQNPDGPSDASDTNPQRLEVRGKGPTGLSPSQVETPSLVPARASPVGGSPRAGSAADMDQTLARMAEERRRQQVH